MDKYQFPPNCGYEIIIIDDEVDTDTRQKIEGYLAWKWGLEGDLAGDHPYKRSAPTI